LAGWLVVKNPTINLESLTILIGDSNQYARRITHSILRSFGANKILEVENALELVKLLSARKIDIFICDERLPPHGGLAMTRTIRRNEANENRTIPILLMTGDARESTIARSRDVGANMVIAKPMSPKGLYDRLAWIAYSPRNFVDTETYFGPDRRFKIEGYPGGVGRRKSDKAVEVATEVGPTLAQLDIDNLFGAARAGAIDDKTTEP
jgi:CheY-like chemotaxis protein